MRQLRATHLATHLDRWGGRFAIWGAGPSGRRLARALEAHKRRATFFIDIDPRKIGRVARRVAIVDPETGVARARQEEVLILVVVAARGARDLVRTRLGDEGMTEGADYLCAI
jgi:FlaA1/EpsC-like NDP-sugar epimerase